MTLRRIFLVVIELYFQVIYLFFFKFLFLDFLNLILILDKKIDHAISSWWGNAMDNDNDNVIILHKIFF